MKQSIVITEAQLSEAIMLVGISLRQRIDQKGRDSFVNPNEMWGVTEVEVNGLREAVHSKVFSRIQEELLDVAVSCVLGIASLRAHGEPKKPVQGENA